jgi:hypothetical protein
MAQAIYELDPIGVDGALEAVAIHWYCNEGCASRAKIEGPTSTGENNDAEDGAVCETCGKEIVNHGEGEYARGLVTKG